jgi:hypothetical protein
MKKESVDNKRGDIEEIEAYTVGHKGDRRIKHCEMTGLLPTQLLLLSKMFLASSYSKAPAAATTTIQSNGTSST